MNKAIVIGCHVNGLGVIRSLALKNIHVIALHYDKTADFAQTSCHVSESVESPHPGKEEKEFIDFLLRNSDRWKNAILFETNDDAAIAVSKHRNELQQHFHVVIPDWSVLRTLIVKRETYQLAKECDVPYPTTLFPASQDDLEKFKNEISFPCILKPIVSHLFFSEFASKSFKVNNFDQLLAKFDFCSRSGHDVMMQEIIPGPDSNIYQCMMYIDSQGVSRSAFNTKKLRQNPPHFGVARVAISDMIYPEMVKHTERMLARIGFHGIVHSEFKKDPRDDVFKLMEINGRISRSNWLTTYCGMSFPWIALKDLSNNEKLSVNDYKKNLYWIELSKDISNSIFHHRDENISLREYIEPYLSKDKTFADISRTDWKPFFKRILCYFEK